MKKKFFALSLVILLYAMTISIMYIPKITLFDGKIIVLIQELLKNIPLAVASAFNCILYSSMIAMPIICLGLYFIKSKRLKELVQFSLLPIVATILNLIIKPLIARERPPMNLLSDIHPHSYSFVSTHSLVTCCIWGMVIYYTNKYCSNKPLKIVISLLSVLWILLIGLSRIWLGVHYPTDVIGGYMLALILIISFIRIGEKQ